MKQDLENTIPNLHFFKLDEASKILNTSYYEAYKKTLTYELCGCLIGGVWRPEVCPLIFIRKKE